MGRDKQIEEMRPQEIKELVDLLVDYGRKYDDSIRGCEDIVAELIVTNGYRKASEVAREIFEEIESMINLICAMTGIDITVYGKYAELKKKYTEGER